MNFSDKIRNDMNIMENRTDSYNCNYIQSTATNTSVISNEDGILVSSETLELIRKIFYCGLFPVLFLVGYTGNIFCLIVLSKEKKYTSTKVLLSLLTLADLFILSGGVFNTLMMIALLYYPTAGYAMYVRQIPFFSAFFAPTFYNIKMEITAIISAERLIAVFSPLRVKTVCSKRLVLSLSITLAILITVALVPQMFVYEIIEITVPCSEPVIVAVLTEFGKNTEFYRLYTVVTGGLFFVIPFCIVFVSTMIIIVTLSRRRNIFSTDFHMATARLEIQEGTITRTLVAMTTIFIICLSPMTILSIITIIDPDNKEYRYKNNTYVVVSTISYFLLNLDSTVNFFIYMIFGSKYRRIFISLFQSKKE
jgi:hypothetical protein